MTTISLSLAPPALVRLHDVLMCLSKFSDTVAIEAEHDLVKPTSEINVNAELKKFWLIMLNIASAECAELHKDGICLLCV